MSSPQQIVELPLAQVDADLAYQYRAGELDVAELKESIEQDGQMIPIMVRQKGDKYQLISGNRRTEALRQLGRSTVKAIVLHDYSDQQLSRIALLENLQRTDLTAWDRVATAARLEDQGMSKAEIAKAFHLHVRSIERLLKIAREAPTSFKEALQRNEIAINQAYEALTRGIPLTEILKKGRSVSFLRSHGKKASAKPAVTFRGRFIPGKDDPKTVIHEAEVFIAKVRKLMDEQKNLNPNPSRTKNRTPGKK
jgi:ParB/RepB/Spo0J family partition protein